jgi:hypothetical protein
MKSKFKLQVVMQQNRKNTKGGEYKALYINSAGLALQYPVAPCKL